MNKNAKHKGFTLLELLASLLIAFIILSLGLPTFSTVIENSKRKETVYALMGMLNFARDMAVSSSENVVICPSDDGFACIASRDWAKTLLVFVDKNRNNKLDEEENLLRNFDYADTKHSLNWKSFGNKTYLNFYADGSTGFQSGRIFYCYDEGEDLNNKAQIIVYRTGRSRIAAPQEFKSGC